MKKKKSEKDKYIARKMHMMAGEDRPQKQKLAIAYSYAKKKGYG
jgi:hypothetical protein